VPGQVYYNATRKLVLKGVDAIVFVADSSRAKLDENLESLRNLEQNLNEHGMSLDEIPWVIQYNKRDVADAMAVPDLDARLNPLRVPGYEAVATSGKGVYETFHGIATLVYRVLKDRLERGDLATEPARVQANPVPAPAVAVRAPRPAAVPAEGELEFDSAIDSMLREVDSPGVRPAARVAPVPRPAPVASAPRPAPVSSVQATVDGTRPAPVPASPMRTEAPRPPAHAAPESLAPSGASPFFAPGHEAPASRDHAERAAAPESFDLELGRLPSLDDASFASDSAREEGPHEFVTDPMRRPLAADAATPPRVTRAESAPVEFNVTRVESAPAEFSVTVPVLLTRAQIQAGVPVRLLLDIRVKDE